VSEGRRKKATGLSDEELAFYDAIVGVGARVYDQPFLCDLVREVVQAVRHNLKVDWTKPHRDSVKAGVQSAVKMVLRRKADLYPHLFGWTPGMQKSPEMPSTTAPCSIYASREIGENAWNN